MSWSGRNVMRAGLSTGKTPQQANSYLFRLGKVTSTSKFTQFYGIFPSLTYLLVWYGCSVIRLTTNIHMTYMYLD